MATSRRIFLTRTAGAAGLAAAGNINEALATPERPFLYNGNDYVNPLLEPSRMRGVYLDQIPGIALIHTWATWCKPCIAEIPEYNKFISKHAKNEGVIFVSALSENALRQEGPKEKPEDFTLMCVHNLILQRHKGINAGYNAMIEDLKSPPYSTELQEMVSNCEKAKETKYEPGSRPNHTCKISQ